MDITKAQADNVLPISMLPSTLAKQTNVVFVRCWERWALLALWCLYCWSISLLFCDLFTFKTNGAGYVGCHITRISRAGCWLWVAQAYGLKRIKWLFFGCDARTTALGFYQGLRCRSRRWIPKIGSLFTRCLDRRWGKDFHRNLCITKNIN